MSHTTIGHLKRLAPPLVALSLITNLAILVNPIFMMQVLDRVVSTGNLHTLGMLLLVAIGALLLQSIVDFLRDVSFLRAAHWVERSTLPAVLSAPTDIRDKAMNDRSKLVLALSGNAATTALSVPWMPLFFLVLWAINPWFLTLASGLVILITLSHLVSSNLQSGPKDRHAQLSKLEAATLKNAERVIHGSGMPGLYQNLLDRIGVIMEQRLETADQMVRPTVAGSASTTFLRGVTQLLGLSLGATLVVFGDLSAGGMIAASLILARSVANFEQVLTNWSEISAAHAAFMRLSQLSGSPARSGTDIESLSGALTCHGLIFPRGGGAPARLDRIGFDLPAGKCLAVIGSSGGGKTTLLEALSGIAPCPIGAVLLDQTDIKTLPLTSLAKHIGYLPQQAQLFHGTLAENICGFSPAPQDSRIISAAKTAGVHGLISALPQSYDTDIGAEPFLLSAGQKQRVALARAIYQAPRYLFLDEPNALLDAAGERQLCAALARLKAMGTTIVMVIHRSGLMGLADFVLALERGRMVDFGPRTEVLGRMNGGRRRVEVPLLKASLLDLTDWIGAQFSRSGDAELSRRAEVLATELFNFALAEGSADDMRAASFQFRYLSETSCEISITEDRPTKAKEKIRKVASLLNGATTDLSDLAEDEAALAAISRMSDAFDVRSVDGQSVFRAALSTPQPLANGRARH